MPDDIKSQMGLLDEIIAKKDLIKKEQEENIRVYTERFRALDKEYTELLAQKNEIQKYLDLAFVERKDELNRLIKEAEDVLIKNKEVLQGAYTKEYEVEKLRSDLAAKIADIDKKAGKNASEAALVTTSVDVLTDSNGLPLTDSNGALLYEPA